MKQVTPPVLATWLLLIGCAGDDGTATTSTAASTATTVAPTSTLDDTSTTGMTTAESSSTTSNATVTDGTTTEGTTTEGTTTMCEYEPTSSTGDGKILGCEGVEVPEPERKGATMATVMESAELVTIALKWSSSGCSCDSCGYNGLEASFEINIDDFAVGIQPALGNGESSSGSNPSSGGSSGFGIMMVELVEITDSCVSGRIFTEDAEEHGFVAGRV